MIRNTRSATLLLPLLTVMGTPVMAQFEVACSFTTECYEAEACDKADFSFKLGAGTMPGQADMRTTEGTVTGQIGGDDVGALYWIAETPKSVQVLSWGPDGSARYTLHLTDGPAIVSYQGTCEAE